MVKYIKNNRKITPSYKAIKSYLYYIPLDKPTLSIYRMWVRLDTIGVLLYSKLQTNRDAEIFDTLE